MSKFISVVLNYVHKMRKKRAYNIFSFTTFVTDSNMYQTRVILVHSTQKKYLVKVTCNCKKTIVKKSDIKSLSSFVESNVQLINSPHVTRNKMKWEMGIAIVQNSLSSSLLELM